MFLDFAGMMINTNYIISIYKIRSHNKYFEINIKLYPSNNTVKEFYDTKQDANIRLDEIVKEINK